jgi:ATP-dependent Clp protease ATP-binding subunit ClpC
MFGKFTEEAQKVLIIAKKEMQELKHPYVGSEHLLLAILKENNSVSSKLKLFNIEYQRFKDELIKVVGRGNIKSEWFLYTPLLKRVIENAILDAKENNDDEVTIEHLFCSILEEGEGVAIRILLGMNIEIENLYNAFSRNLIKKKKGKKKLVIEELGIDITKKAKDGELDPVVGRESEIKRMLEIIKSCNK